MLCLLVEIRKRKVDGNVIVLLGQSTEGMPLLLSVGNMMKNKTKFIALLKFGIHLLKRPLKILLEALDYKTQHLSSLLILQLKRFWWLAVMEAQYASGISKQGKWLKSFLSTESTPMKSSQWMILSAVDFLVMGNAL